MGENARYYLTEEYFPKLNSIKTYSIFFLLNIFFCLSINAQAFKAEQVRYSRVKTAYDEKEASIKEKLKSNNIRISELEILLRYYKSEKELQLWGKNKSDNSFILLKTFKACSSSGKIGPKRKQGDLQTPEGFYFVDRFNPSSNYYLSLGINYPNYSDKILGVKSNLGGDIFIHGKCVTIGCIPITDDLIKELYVYCVEAKNNNNKINVVIFPAKLTATNYTELINLYNGDNDKINLWKDLKIEYDYFETNKKLSKIQFLSTGRHKIN